MSRANAALALPPGDRDDAPVPPPLAAPPPDPTLGVTLELDAIGTSLTNAAVAFAALAAARERGDEAACSQAATALVAALKPDPRHLARRIAEAFDGALSRSLREPRR